MGSPSPASSCNVNVSDHQQTGITIAGNFIGTAAAGTTASAGDFGVFATGSAGLTIGGTAPADRNLISGNAGAGIFISRFSDTTPFVMGVHGNLIGTDVTGQAALANGHGILIETTSDRRLVRRSRRHRRRRRRRRQRHRGQH